MKNSTVLHELGFDQGLSMVSTPFRVGEAYKFYRYSVSIFHWINT